VLPFATHITSRIAAATLFGVLLAAPAAGQASGPILSEITPSIEREAWSTHPSDSVRVLSNARSAQSRFELVRRNHLPWTWDRGSGPCDERIGRFCLWYGDGTSTWRPPPDPEPVVDARAVLIARLDTAAAVVPGDWWVSGQRVRYLVEAERFDDAAAAARACRSRDAGWCEALLGYALHSSGDYVRADSAFRAALLRMPERERERWTDLAPLLELGAVRAYRRLDAGEREQFEARFWWLAEPLYMVPGNDRRTEHFARHVVDRLQDRARQTEGIAWGSDLRELLLRYGSPVGWERIRPRTPGLDSNAGMVTRYAPGSRYFDPPRAHVQEPHRIAEDGWDLEYRRARTSYAPAYAAPVEALDYQLAVFRRGDSVRVASSHRLREDSLGVRHPAEAAATFASGPAAPRQILRGDADSRPAVLSATLPAEPTLVSLEALARDEKRAARARFGLPLAPPPPHGLSVSDILLFDEADPLPEELDAALPHMRGTTESRAGERLALFFELYGLSAADLPVDVAVQMVDENVGWMRRAAQRVGIARVQHPLTVRWQEAPQDPGEVYARSLVIQVPDVSAGTYSLQLRLTPRGREPLTTRRTLTVVD
jgi:hypothetical protein